MGFSINSAIYEITVVNFQSIDVESIHALLCIFFTSRCSHLLLMLIYQNAFYSCISSYFFISLHAYFHSIFVIVISLLLFFFFFKLVDLMIINKNKLPFIVHAW